MSSPNPSLKNITPQAKVMSPIIVVITWIVVLPKNFWTFEAPYKRTAHIAITIVIEIPVITIP